MNLLQGVRDHLGLKALGDGLTENVRAHGSPP